MALIPVVAIWIVLPGTLAGSAPTVAGSVPSRTPIYTFRTPFDTAGIRAATAQFGFSTQAACHSASGSNSEDFSLATGLGQVNQSVTYASCARVNHGRFGVGDFVGLKELNFTVPTSGDYNITAKWTVGFLVSANATITSGSTSACSAGSRYTPWWYGWYLVRPHLTFKDGLRTFDYDPLHNGMGAWVTNGTAWVSNRTIQMNFDGRNHGHVIVFQKGQVYTLSLRLEVEFGVFDGCEPRGSSMHLHLEMSAASGYGARLDFVGMN